jgi:hypothetical protein
MNWTNRHTLFAGLGLIVLVNAIALAGVAWNRSEPADSRLQLSERELGSGYDYWRKENSGISLRLDYRWPDTGPGDVNGYSFADGNRVSPTKMRELGFVLPVELNAEAMRQYRRQRDRDGLLVLEFNGPQYQQQLQRTQQRLAKSTADLAAVPDNKQLIESHKRAREDLQREQTRASRLFVIDAGAERQTLRARYPDRQRYAIVRGRFETWSWHDDGSWQFGGSAQIPVAHNINLPQRWHQLFADLPKRKKVAGYTDSGGDRLFNAELVFGQRLEPWISQLQAGQAE